MSKPVLGLLAGLALVSAAPLMLSPKGSRNAPDVGAMQDLLAHLRVLRQIYHTTHWNVSGGDYYGDHLLFQRLYAGEGSGPTLDDQIDGLGERMVRYFGGHTVSDSLILPRMGQIASRAESESDPIRRAFRLEQDTHRAIEGAYEALKAAGHKTLGLDDFLMALADERDTVLYLLGQRLDEPAKFSASSGSLSRRELKVGDLVQSRYRAPWYGEVVSVERRKKTTSLVGVRVLATKDGRRARKMPVKFYDAMHFEIVSRIPFRPEAGSASIMLEGSRACGCGSRACAGYCGSKNCSCGTG